MLPACEARAVRAAFDGAGIAAAADLVALYGRLGGMEVPDDNEWRLFSLEEVAAENADGHPYGAVFADYLLACSLFRIRPATAEVSEVYVDHGDELPPMLVATSLEAFLQALAIDPMSVLEPRRLGAQRLH